jgi:hypothetical protein
MQVNETCINRGGLLDHGLSNHRGASAQADSQKMYGGGLHLVSPRETPTPTQLFSFSPTPVHPDRSFRKAGE